MVGQCVLPAPSCSGRLWPCQQDKHQRREVHATVSSHTCGGLPLRLPRRSAAALPAYVSSAPLPRLRAHAVQDSLSQELRASSSVRDSSFSFRLRRAPGAPPHLQWVYAHVFCRCRHDERLRRGAEQKSVVLLSWLPLYSVLEPLARLAGPVALSYGPEALRQVCALGAPPWVLRAPVAGCLLRGSPRGWPAA